MRALIQNILVLVFLGIFTASGANAKTFARSETAAEALRIEAELKRVADGGGRAAHAWLEDGLHAIRGGDWRAASTAFATALGLDPKNEQAWRNYAVSLLRIDPKDWDERYNLPRRAEAAAYNSYLLAQGPQAEARSLALLADAFERRELYRPAIDAMKSSLDLADTAETRARYTALRDQYGFRMLDYSVDADTASARACVQFSEELAKGRIDFAPYVTVAGIDQPAVSAEGSQICVEGLEHGRDYAITIRQGVPSEVGETLQRTVELAIYVRDRSPSVRFTGRNYVLPSRGQNGVPLVTVNIDAVEAELYRISDRGIAPAVISGDFQNQLMGGDLETLKETTGIKVWSGEMPVDNTLNADVTTAFPVSEAIGTLEPGVYVLLAWPKGQEMEYWDPRATQWFVVSDLGLTALSAGDGIHAVVRSLSSAEPVAGAKLSLIARSNEVLGTAETDANGVAHFAGGLTRGTGGAAPALLVAEAGETDYALLNLTQSPFDLSDRGVEGRAAPGPLDVFLTTERGVYRPGETVHLTALLRDAEGKAVPDLPLTLVVTRPDGAEDRRDLVADAGAGGRAHDVALLDTATTGTWRVRAYADPGAPAIGETSFLVEDYIPERLDLTLNASAATIARGAPVTVEAEGRWLYGAPAADLAVEGELVVSATDDAVPGFAGYRFGLADETFTAIRTPLAAARTDGDGKAAFTVALPQLPATTRTLQAKANIRLREPGGRTIERNVAFTVKPEGTRIGVRPLFDGSIGEGETASFDVSAINPAGERIALAGVRWELLRIERRYQWYQEDGRWQSQVINATRRVADGTLDLTAGEATRISAAVDWGQYRLDVMTGDPAGPATSITFDAGWSAGASADSPDMLGVALEKDAYAAGETAQLRIEAPFAGKAAIVLVGEGVRRVIAADVPEGSFTLPIKVGNDWGAGLYVVASLARPLDEAASRMPGRAVGLAWLGIDAAPRTLNVVLDVPERARPRESLTVPMRLTGLDAGKAAYVTLAAVDVGILNLTAFESPAPTNWYYGQRALGAEMRDLYGQLIDGMRAARGRLRSGGDGMEGGLMGEPPTQEPLALFSGVVPVGANGEAEVTFDLPAFNGTMRLMAMAWSDDKVGEAEADVVVADPVVVTASHPRFLAMGDESRLRLDIHNATGAAGTYRLSVTAEGPLTLDNAGEHSLDLAQDARTTLDLPLFANNVGSGLIDIALTAPDGTIHAQRISIGTRAPYPSVTRRSRLPLAANGGSATLDGNLVADLYPGAQVSVSVDPLASLDVAGRLAALDLYPYGCTEQIASRALPMLYLSELDTGGQFAGTPVEERLRDAVRRVLARQDSTGGFGLWGAGGDDMWLNAYAIDFLSRAREKGIAVPERAMSLALDRLRNTLNYRGDIEDGAGGDIAYAHYVLARNGRARLGDLRYIADAKLDALGSPLARAQIGAALAILGDRTRAARAFASAGEALQDDDLTEAANYGGPLRDGAAILALAAETDAAAQIVPAVARRVDQLAEERRYFSTQENAWMVLASRALKARSADIRLEVDGAAHAGAFNRVVDAAALEQAALTIANRSGEAAELVVTVQGVPHEAEAPEEQGFNIERRYYALDGSEIDLASIRQNERFVVVLTTTEYEPQGAQVLVVDHLPAGIEIDNPRLVSGGDTGAFGWLPEESPAHAEFRDDRFVAAFDTANISGNTYVAAYVARAVTPGTYTRPPAMVEDMYDPERFARTGTGTIEVTAQ